MAQGRHRKKKDINYGPIALGSAVALGATGVLAGAAPATAATESEWDRVAQCESGGRWNLSWGHADSTGGLQIQDRTWRDFGGTAIAPHAYQATKEQQIMIAEKILAVQGPRAWSVTWNGTCPGATLSRTPYAAPAAPEPKPEPPRRRSVEKKPEKSHEAPPVGKTGGTYTVKSGDWLMKIARKELGSSAEWRAIYDLNKSVIGDNPNLIFPKQVFKMPGGSVAESVHKAKPKPEAPAPKPEPKAPSSNAAYVLPVQGRIGDSLIIGSGGSMSRSAGGHSGLDITAPHGTPVGSAAAGTVASINSSGGAYGLHVVVRHGDGVYTLYAHLSAISVGVGQSVVAGQQVGNVGSTGNSSGPHLHFEVRNHPTAFRSGVFLNPLTWLRSHGVSV